MARYDCVGPCMAVYGYGCLCMSVYSSRGGDSDMKWTGMLVVSLRGVNFGFWSRLGCSGQNVIIFSRQGLV